MNKIVILKNNGGRLANQLWQFASIYAYCLENLYQYENYAFFQYNQYFNFLVEDRVVKFLFFNNFYTNKKIKKFFFLVYSTILEIIFCKHTVRDRNREFFLPPTINDDLSQKKILNDIALSHGQTYYFCGWLFRNPIGLEKFRKEIEVAFRPTGKYLNEVTNFIKKIKQNGKFLVGVHIRQGDYRKWQGGLYYFTCRDARAIVDDFLLSQLKYAKENTTFIVCSDETIEEEEFGGLDYVVGPGSEITDLYALASTDLIIGSNSTYGLWAAYYGNIPFVRFSKEKIDWAKSIQKTQ